MLELSNKITLATKISLESGACFYVPVIVHWQGQHPTLCCVASFLDSFVNVMKKAEVGIRLPISCTDKLEESLETT